MRVTTEDAARARESLSYLKPGDTVYTIIRSVSRSGMKRDVSVVTFQPYGKTTVALHPNWAVAVLIGASLNREGGRDAIVRRGCGYDVAADVVQNLSYALFGSESALRHESL